MLGKSTVLAVVAGLLASGALAGTPQVVAKPATQVNPKPRVVTSRVAAQSCRLDAPLIPQQTGVWCWAASSAMVMNFLVPSLNVQQCDEANKAMSLNNCCQTPIPGPCVRTGWEMLGAYGFRFDFTDGTALSFEQLKHQVCDVHCPVMYAWGWTGGGGHMMVVVGTTSFLGTESLEINDPWPPNVGDNYVLSYTDWVSGPDHVHWADFYNVRKELKIPSRVTLRYRPPIRVFPEVVALATPVEVSIEQEAMKSAERLRTQVTAEHARVLGFASVAEVASASLGTPIRELHVGLEQLGKFAAGANPRSLLTGGQAVLFPLLVNGQVRSAIRVQNKAVQSFGSAGLVRLIAGTGVSLGAASKTAVPAVRIPGLGLYFLAREEAAELQIAPLFDEPSMGLKKGVYEPASKVFQRLQPLAIQAKDRVM